ncbi:MULTISPECIES: hypothetical protein [unclassified Paenibacillus]|uniref:hypothetical protein n=1 Tax=unclassified Paenibacillus TaxID=185978 RepID=UPI001AE6E3B8|nr:MULTISPECIES: hypothetical protein [unclassified Paenibacillus]MBP1155882.1 hypothetical protein [Paenibacillus sp. PvP091]MBP1168732.1 hypothetical protein [Paenibacillus sp. PvR098]MBP2439760.1 hypothetical protein [Paenibacillus sp. PvP052]
MEKSPDRPNREEEKYTSPASPLPDYELKMLQKYIHDVNLQKLSESLPRQKKNLMLIKFFKHKRNQRVEIVSSIGAHKQHTLGKVANIGRDFVVLTTLWNRIWIPYRSIQSSNIPAGLPDVSNTHQHVVFDEQLRRRLLTQFGKTVGGHDILKQQFYEDSLQTSLQSWKGASVTVTANETMHSGKIVYAASGTLSLQNAKNRFDVNLRDVDYIKLRRIKMTVPYMLNLSLRLYDRILKR